MFSVWRGGGFEVDDDALFFIFFFIFLFFVFKIKQFIGGVVCVCFFCFVLPFTC